MLIKQDREETARFGAPPSGGGGRGGHMGGMGGGFGGGMAPGMNRNLFVGNVSELQSRPYCSLRLIACRNVSWEGIVERVHGDLHRTTLML